MLLGNYEIEKHIKRLSEYYPSVTDHKDTNTCFPTKSTLIVPLPRLRFVTSMGFCFRLNYLTCVIQAYPISSIHVVFITILSFGFCFWRYLTRGLIWHISQSSIRPSIYFSSIVNSLSNPFLEPTSTKQ